MSLKNYYNTGTVSVANGATAVTGVGTAWAAFIAADDILWIDGVSCRILSVTDNLDLTLAYPWPGATATDATYEIRLPSPSADVTSGLRGVVEALQTGTIATLQGLSASEGDVLQYLSGAWTVSPFAVSLAGSFTTAGAYSLTLTQTGNTNVTLPTTGTLATLAGSETLTNKAINASNNAISNLTTAMFAAGVIDTDGTMAANSNTRISSQAAVVTFVETLVQGLAWKKPVACVAVNDIALTGEQTIDGVVTNGSRVLVTNQTTGSENGIYVSAAGAWARAVDGQTGDDLVYASTIVEGGTVYADTVWTCNTPSITLGTTTPVFVQSGTLTVSYTAGAGLNLTGTAFSIASAGVTSSMLASGLTLGGGVTISGNSVIGAPTGGFQGPGTINAQGLYVNGVAVGVAADFIYTPTTYTATSGQTSFAANYTVQGGVAYVDVWRNGVKISRNDLTLTSGTAVVLAVPCEAGDIVEILAYQTLDLTTPSYTNPVTFMDGGKWNASGISGTKVANISGKNRLINGDFRVSQYNGSAALTPSNGLYVIDRWFLGGTQHGKFTFQQSANGSAAPSAYAAGLTVASVFAPASTDQLNFQQNIEGLNITDFQWGTANAKTVTLSFWAYATITGTYAASLRNSPNSHSYVFSYNIAAANTWTKVSVTIPGPTVGTWPVDNSGSIVLFFDLGAGSTWQTTANTWQAGDFRSVSGAVQLCNHASASWLVTDVQLELGTVATDFDRKIYSQALEDCQRYYEVWDSANSGGTAGASNSTSDVIAMWHFKVPKRATPVITLPTPGSVAPDATFLTATGAIPGTIGTLGADLVTQNHVRITGSGWTGVWPGGGVATFFWVFAGGVLSASAEL